jgi:hypothetical protein
MAIRASQPQPQAAISINPSNPLFPNVVAAWVGAHPCFLLGVNAAVPTALGAFSQVINSAGVGLALPEASGGFSILSDCNRLFPDSARTTILVYRQSRDTTNRASSLFGYANGAKRVQAHAPYSDGIIYWDFESDGVGTGRVSAAFTKSTNPETLAFVAGPRRGREIWRNGVRIANNSNAAVRTTASSTSFNIGKGGVTTSDFEDIFALVIAADEWAPEAIQAWSANPWQLFSYPRKRLGLSYQAPLMAPAFRR